MRLLSSLASLALMGFDSNVFYSPEGDGGAAGTETPAASAPETPAAPAVGAGTETPAAETPSAEPTAEEKARNREGYEQRKAKQEADALRTELEGYKRREEDARKAKLTEEQRLKEERDQLKEENDRLRVGALRSKVASEFKLPAALADRLIGSDEASLRADAEEMAKLLPKVKVGEGTSPNNPNGSKRIYTRAELRADTKLAQSEDARKAMYEGRIKD